MFKNNFKFKIDKSFHPILSLALLVSISATSSYAADTSLRIDPTDGVLFGGVFGNKADETAIKNGYQLSESIWKGFSDLDILSIGGSGRVHVGIKIKREVVQSKDGLGYLTTDTFEIPVAIPLFNAEIGHLVSSSLPVSLSLGLTGGLKVSDTRWTIDQNVASKMAQEGDSELIKLVDEEFKNKDWYETLKKEKDSLEKDENRLDLDPLRKARYSSLVNRIAAPLKIPLKAEAVKKLEYNEIIKYEGSGGVTFGPSIRFGNVIKGSASLGVFMNGRFQVSVMKVLKNINGEKKEVALLKVKEVESKGIEASIGGRKAIDGEVLEILDANSTNKAVGKLLDLEFIPFKKKITRKKSDVVEVAYEFDLTNDEAVSAYELAVFGVTHVADKMSDLSESTGVKRIYDKKAKEFERVTTSGFKLSYGLKKEKNCYSKIEDANVTYYSNPQDKVQIEMRAIAHCDIEESGFLNGLFTTGKMNDHRRYGFHFEGAYNRDKSASLNEADFGLYAKGVLDDRHTMGHEMSSYTDMINTLTFNSFDRTGVSIPSLPKSKLIDNNNSQLGGYDYEQIDYGRLRIYLAMGFSKENLITFLNFNDKNKKFEIVKNAFKGYLNQELLEKNISRSDWEVHAKVTRWASNLSLVNLIRSNCKSCRAPTVMTEFLKDWDNVSENFKKSGRTDQDVKKVLEKLRKMFSQTQFGYEFAEVLVKTLEASGVQEQNAPKFELRFESSAFNAPIVAGTTIDLDKLPGQNSESKLIQETWDPTSIAKIDTSSEVIGLGLSKDLKRLRVRYRNKPTKVRIILQESGGFDLNRDVLGVLDRDITQIEQISQDTIELNTLELLESANIDLVDLKGLYRIGVQISQDGQVFGPMVYKEKVYIQSN